MRSASRHRTRFAAVTACGLLLAGSVGGCATTQETAARKRAQSERILERHERKREHRRSHRKEGVG